MLTSSRSCEQEPLMVVAIHNRLRLRQRQQGAKQTIVPARRSRGAASLLCFCCINKAHTTFAQTAQVRDCAFKQTLQRSKDVMSLHRATKMFPSWTIAASTFLGFVASSLRARVRRPFSFFNRADVAAKKCQTKSCRDTVAHAKRKAM